MTISIGSDHRGYLLKKTLTRYLSEKDIEVSDEGSHSPESADYPVFASAVGLKVTEKKADFGILVCGSGIGMSVAANRIKGVRAALCTSKEQILSSRRHNDANVLVLASDLTTEYLAISWVDAWLNEKFEGGRHQKRIQQIDNN
ncbi:ribose 5-phosphate isomerase B [candidate division WOR-3 bacterium]|nr:ribose 5-phosphate isomerase B [candidate division WOR-3 bacterium]